MVLPPSFHSGLPFLTRLEAALAKLGLTAKHGKEERQTEERVEDEEAKEALQNRLQDAEMKNKHLEEDNQDLRQRLEQFKGFCFFCQRGRIFIEIESTKGKT